MRADGVRIAPVWDEVCDFHDVMLRVLTSLGVAHCVIECLDRQQRVDFVVQRITDTKRRLTSSFLLQESEVQAGC